MNGYTVGQLNVKLAEQGLIQTGEKACLNPAPIGSTTIRLQKTKAKWGHGEPARPKHFFIRILSDKSSRIQGLTPEEAWESSEWLKKYPKDRFVSNLENLKMSTDAGGGVLLQMIMKSLRQSFLLAVSQIRLCGHFGMNMMQVSFLSKI